MVSGSEPRNEQLEALERRLRQIEYDQRILARHVAAIERSAIFRMLRRLGHPVLDFRTRIDRWLSGWPWLRRRLSASEPHPSWLERPAPVGSAQNYASTRFSIILRAESSSLYWLKEAVSSVQDQTHSCWDLWICHESDTGPDKSAYLSSLALADPRIRIVTVSGGKGMIHAVNEAATLSTADYLLLVDSGNLSREALRWLASAAPADVIYADEGQFDAEGRSVRVTLRPDWSPDLLLSCMYLGHPTAISRLCWERAGGLRPEFDASSEHDLLLRISEGRADIRHVPEVLFHKMPAAKSANDSTLRAVAHTSGRKAVRDALQRRGFRADIEDGSAPGQYRVRWMPDSTQMVSLIIPTRSPRLLEKCLAGVAARTRYPTYEVIVIQHLGHDDFALERVIERHHATRIPYSGPFHFSHMNNLAADTAKGDVLVFLNDDVEPLESSWLERLVAQVQRPGVGVAGAQLLYPSGTLQHAGIVVGIGDGCGHIGRGSFEAAHWPWLGLTREVSAVTGACLAIRTSLFRELGGFAALFPVNYNDADLCLRARDAGYRVLYESAALLRHYECQTRLGFVTFDERQRWYARWKDLIDAGDPYYSPHLTQEREDLSLRGPLES